MKVNPLYLLTSPEIKEIFSLFHELTGLVISFTELKENGMLVFFPSEKKAKYCELIQSIPEGKKRCYKSDLQGVKKAIQEQGPAIYRCHAGLINVAIPLFYKENLVGAIITGQLLTENPEEKDFSKIRENLNSLPLDFKELREAYFSIQVIPRDKLFIATRFLSLIASYLVEKENRFVLQEKLIRKQRQLLEEKRELEKLRSQLRKYFTSFQTKERFSSTPERIIIRAKEFMDKNFNRPLSLKEISQKLYLSPPYFSYLFKKHTGLTFTQYLRKVRIEAAKRLLMLQPHLSIKNIAFAVGFSDPDYFCKVFKRMEGITPTQFSGR